MGNGESGPVGRRRAADHGEEPDGLKERKRSRFITPSTSSSIEQREEPQTLLFSCHPTGMKTLALLQDSSTSCQNELEMSYFQLEPKHKVFFSHARAQKDFVEQLCVDHETHGYLFPFFDKRSHSLPKGMEFPSLILEAAKQCRVAVIVLSEEFMTSKWPMVELTAFYDAQQGGNPQLHMLPLFFSLSVGDLDDWSIENRWMPRWREFCEADTSIPKRIDLKRWRAAVKALRSVNGLIFEKFAKSEVAYRSAVTQAVIKLSPPDLMYGTSKSVVGWSRLCEILSNQFVEDTNTGTFLLGLYGSSGFGKSTIARGLCDYFYRDFLGRVCYVELDMPSRTLERQKEVLEKLCNIDKSALDRIKTTGQGWNLILQNMKRQPVLLVIDNVTGDAHSRGEVQQYLGAGFHPRSRIMITSRSKAVVQELMFESRYCKPMPNLTYEEAGTIFLKAAAPRMSLTTITDRQRQILKMFTKECAFARDEFGYKKFYHPLALQALGSYFFEVSNNCLIPWEEYIEAFKKFKLSGEFPSIYRILTLQFSAFTESEQLLFLDLAIYGGEYMARSYISIGYSVYDRWVTWLAGLHEEEPIVIESQLRRLMRSGMIQCFPGDNYPLWHGMAMHKLYTEFAAWYVSQGEGSKRVWCVYHNAYKNCSLPKQVRRKPPSNFWPDLMRVHLAYFQGNIPRKIIQEWCNVVLLQLYSCTNLKVLNLHGLRCLRHLELVELKDIVTLTLTEDSSTSEADSMDEELIMDSLQFVLLEKLESLQRLPDFRSCSNLQALTTRGCISLSEPPRIEQCSELKVLKMEDWHPRQGGLLKLTTLSSMLHLIVVGNPTDCSKEDVELDLEGLRYCSRLKTLRLEWLPVKRLLGLTKLTKLESVRIKGCSRLDEIPGLSPRCRLGLQYHLALKTDKIKLGPDFFVKDPLVKMHMSRVKLEEFVLMQIGDHQLLGCPEDHKYSEDISTCAWSLHVFDTTFKAKFSKGMVYVIETEDWKVNPTTGSNLSPNEWETKLSRVYAMRKSAAGVPYIELVLNMKKNWESDRRRRRLQLSQRIFQRCGELYATIPGTRIMVKHKQSEARPAWMDRLDEVLQIGGNTNTPFFDMESMQNSIIQFATSMMDGSKRNPAPVCDTFKNALSLL